MKDLENRVKQLERQIGNVETVQRKAQEVLNDAAQTMTQFAEMIGKMSDKLKTHDMIQLRMIRVIERFTDLFEEMGYSVDVARDEPADEGPPDPTLSPTPPDESDDHRSIG